MKNPDYTRMMENATKVKRLRDIAIDFKTMGVSLNDIEKKYPCLKRLCVLLDQQRGFPIREEIGYLLLDFIMDGCIDHKRG